MRKTRTIKKAIYIITEGETEESYYGRIAEIIGQEADAKYSVTVKVREIEDGSHTDPVNMVTEGIESKDQYDEIWVVFDKDRARDQENERAIKLAEANGIKVAFSAICFEHWLILHFERKDHAFERSDCESRSTRKNPVVCNCNGIVCACTYLKGPQLLPKYQKGRALIYDAVQAKNITAIENSAWLRKMRRPYTSIHQLNPYTDVDILLCELLNLDRVEYYAMHEPFQHAHLEIEVATVDLNNSNLTVQCNITNMSTAAVLVNKLPFFVRSHNGVEVPFANRQTLTLPPGEIIDASFDFPNIESGPVSLIVKQAGKYLVVDLI